MPMPDLPLIPIVLTLHEALAPARENLNLKSLSKALQGVVDALAVPGQVALEIQIGAESDPAPLRLSVNGIALPCAGEVIARALGYAEGLPPRGPLNRAAALYQLERQLADNPAAFEETLALVSAALIKGRAGVLLTDAVLNQLLGEETLPFAQDTIREALQGVLDLRIGVGEVTATLRLIAAEDPENHQQPLHLRESLIARLVAPTIEVHFHPDYLRTFTTYSDEVVTGFFRDARTNFESFAGAILPSFELCPDPNLKAQALAFKINHLLTLPIIGLTPAEGLANEEASNLITLSLPPRPAANPQIFTQNALVAWSDREQWAQYGVYVWGSGAYVFLAATGAIRDHAPCFVNSERLAAIIEAWESAYPALIALARIRLNLEEVTATARTLVQEGVPIRDLRALLDLLLAAPPGTDLLPYMRRGLRDALTNDLTVGRLTLNIYEVDEKITQLLEHAFTVSEGEMILGAVEEALAYHPGALVYPTLVTTAAARTPLARLLYGTFPRLTVVSRDELSASVDLRYVNTIHLE